MLSYGGHSLVQTDLKSWVMSQKSSRGSSVSGKKKARSGAKAKPLVTCELEQPSSKKRRTQAAGPSTCLLCSASSEDALTPQQCLDLGDLKGVSVSLGTSAKEKCTGMEQNLLGNDWAQCKG